MLMDLIAPSVGLGLGVIAAILSTRVFTPTDIPPRRISPVRVGGMALAGLVLGIWSGLQLDGPLAWAGAAFGVALLLIAVVDAEHFWLPNILTLTLGAAGLAVSLVFGPGRFIDHVIGAAIGFLALAGLAAAYKRLRGRDGLGGGDARLLAALGAWVGWAGLPSILVWASVAGLSWVLARILMRRPPAPDTALPFGTYMAIGAWLTWLYGPLGRAGW